MSAWILIAIYGSLCLQVSSLPWWNWDEKDGNDPAVSPKGDYGKFWWWGDKYDYKHDSQVADDLYQKKWEKYREDGWGKPWWWWKWNKYDGDDKWWWKKDW